MFEHNNRKFTEDEFIRLLVDLKNHTFGDKKSVFSAISTLLNGFVVNDNSRILDYGSGLGQVSAFLYEKFNCNIDAVEPYADWRNKAEFVWRHSLKYNINFIALDEFEFSENQYDLVISTAVIEHVHNPGMYLSNIAKMLKSDGILLIGLPNAMNLRSIFTQLRYSKTAVLKRSKKVLREYYKPNYHINSWDSFHFTTLLSSCGFEVIDFVQNGGIPLPVVNVPLISKYLPSYIYTKVPMLSRLSYGMMFLVKKSHDVDINPFD